MTIALDGAGVPHPAAVPRRPGPRLRAAMEWLGSLAVVAVDGAIASMASQLAGQLQGAVGAALAQAADPGADVIGVLQREPQAELQALLDVIEPVAMQAPDESCPTADEQASSTYSPPVPSEQEQYRGDHQATFDRPRASHGLSNPHHSCIEHSPSTAATDTAAGHWPRRPALERHGRHHHRNSIDALGIQLSRESH